MGGIIFNYYFVSLHSGAGVRINIAFSSKRRVAPLEVKKHGPYSCSYFMT